MYMYLPHTDVVFLGILLKCSESQEELCIITHSLSLHSKNKTLDGWQKKYMYNVRKSGAFRTFTKKPRLCIFIKTDYHQKQNCIFCSKQQKSVSVSDSEKKDTKYELIPLNSMTRNLVQLILIFKGSGLINLQYEIRMCKKIIMTSQ